MILKKLAKQLRREVKTHPKKAAALGLLAVVAIWFWTPLILDWTGLSSPSKESMAEVESQPTLPKSPLGAAKKKPSPAKETKKAPEHPWQTLVAWIEKDPLASAAAPDRKRRDPFHTPKAKVAKAIVKEKKQPEKPPERKSITPEALGLVLSGTAVGARRRVAQINGKAFHEQSVIRVSLDGKWYEFTLRKVDPRRVVLERDKQHFELKIPASVDSDRIDLYGST